MEIDAVVERVERIAAVRSDGAADAGLTEAGLVAVREVTAWADAQQAALVWQLALLVSFPEATIAKTSKTSVATRLQADDGLDRLERQKANTRLNTWVDAEGMWNLRGRFDPVAGMKLAATLDRAIETLFAERVPERCPADPIEKQKFLAAHALERLLHGAASGKPGRPEYLVVVDADAPGPVGPVAPDHPADEPPPDRQRSGPRHRNVERPPRRQLSSVVVRAAVPPYPEPGASP